MSRPPRATGPRDQSPPTTPTRDLLMFELAAEAQHQTRILTQWLLASGRTRLPGKVHNPQPELGLKHPPAPRKATP